MSLVIVMCVVSFAPGMAVPAGAAEPENPPYVAAYQPVQGQEQPADAPITLAFDRAMDEAAVEAAFEIEPAIALKFQLGSGHRGLDFAEGGRIHAGRDVPVLSNYRCEE